MIDLIFEKELGERAMGFGGHHQGMRSRDLLDHRCDKDPGTVGAITRLAALCLAMTLSGLAAAAADDGPDFYAGKTLTVIAGLPPGGGVDGEMRIMTKYLAKYIPGHPTIVSKNMPGAGGIILANFLNTVAVPDGLTLGMPGRSGFLLSNLVQQKGISYDLTKFAYVGGAGSAANALWLHRRTGIKSIADLKASKKDIVIGALSARSENAIAPRVLAMYDHWPLKIVTGYAGFNEVLIAIERGEVDGLFSNEGSVANSRPDLIKSGAMRAFVQSFESMPGVPVLADVIADQHAKALLSLVTTPSHIGLPLLAPPLIPPDRLEILRRSYMQLMDDREYRAEAEQRGLPVGRPISGPELQKLIAESLSSVPEAIVAEYQRLTGIQSDK
jgi:tripartite-type tricarboxylate transporter receptor subunit TctC